MDLGVLEGQTRGYYFLNSIFDPSVKQCNAHFRDGFVLGGLTWIHFWKSVKGRPQRDRLSIQGSGLGLSLNRDPGIESRDSDWDL